MMSIQTKEVKPTVSVIIPTYNRADLVVRALRSVLDQTYQNFEVIVIDDASEDNTRDAVKSFNDERITYIRQNENKGGSAARNRGIKVTKGKYIAFLDSDDEWLPEKLEKQVALFESVPLKVGAIYTGLVYIKEDNKQLGKRIPELEGDISKHVVFDNCVGPLSSGIVRKECLENCGLFDERLPACQDWDIWIRIAKKYDFAFLEEPLVKYNLDNEKITTNPKAKATGHRMILEKYLEDIKKNRQAHSNHIFVTAHYFLLSGESLKGNIEFLRAIFVYPFRPKYYLHLFFSLYGSHTYRKAAALKAILK